MSIQITIKRIGETIHAFQLKSCMGDVITMIEKLTDLTLNFGARTDMNIIREDVRRHRAQALRQTPYVDIMNAKHAVYLRNIFHHRLNIHIARRGFEQNIHRIAQNAPGIVQDEEADQHTDEWIEPVGIREVNDYARNDRADCGEHIAHQMHECGTQVQVMFTTAVHEPGREEIDHHRDESHTDQDAR